MATLTFTGRDRYTTLRGTTNQAVAAVKEAQQQARERKAMQRVGGSSVRYFITDSAGSWIWSGRVDFQSAQSPGTGMANFNILLTSSTSPAFLAAVAVTVESSSDGVTWVPSRSKGLNDPWRVQEGSVLTAMPYVAIYEVEMRGTYMEYRRFKVQAMTSDPVAISVARTL
ncbi:hypothetical protein J2X12_004325 [Pseudarthrobacter oxydans]|uniref:F5/8 type C domain-containing protein n=1 Tax=Pseudarthrobacter oxydans TaxID=1671 RepID=A0AAW8NHA6_PSEOX|nr:hypothetical protein [Pseudarthrobacter oxydans]MDR6794743.1 hypothetical protein [Pseudarthrobacter oxydans]MDR7166271.1 hypothetical protein [Pseudarthrobacter oxydans]